MISGDLEGKAQSICRHIVNCMHVIARNYKQAINNMAQMLAGPEGSGHLEERMKQEKPEIWSCGNHNL